MLTLDLGALQRRGKIRIEGLIPGDHAIFAEAELRFPDGLRADLDASTIASGGVWVRGTLSGTHRTECGRCLKDIEVGFDGDVEIVFSPTDELTGDGDGDGMWPLDSRQSELDLTEVVREEFMLSAPKYALCRPGCEGLCPRCGVNLEEGETCTCDRGGADPRWEALRSLT